jgi:hypothetical protein
MQCRAPITAESAGDANAMCWPAERKEGEAKKAADRQTFGRASSLL